MKYEELLIEADKNGLIVKEFDIPGYGGRIMGNRIAINKKETYMNKGCILAEELGHYHTSTGNILNQAIIVNRKQERTARLWSYNKIVGLSGIIRAYQNRCITINEMADYLEVTEEFLEEALECYRQKYGNYAILDNYIIIFEPSLAVIEKFE